MERATEEQAIQAVLKAEDELSLEGDLDDLAKINIDGED